MGPEATLVGAGPAQGNHARPSARRFILTAQKARWDGGARAGRDLAEKDCKGREGKGRILDQFAKNPDNSPVHYEGPLGRKSGRRHQRDAHAFRQQHGHHRPPIHGLLLALASGKKEPQIQDHLLPALFFFFRMGLADPGIRKWPEALSAERFLTTQVARWTGWNFT